MSAISYPDLFWVLRGAAPTFKNRHYCESHSRYRLRSHFLHRQSRLIPEKFTRVVHIVQNLLLTPQQRIYLVLTNSDVPLNQYPIFIAGNLREGTEETSRKKLAPLYKLGLLSNTSALKHQDYWDYANIGFWTRFSLKQAHSYIATGMSTHKWLQN